MESNELVNLVVDAIIKISMVEIPNVGFEFNSCSAFLLECITQILIKQKQNYISIWPSINEHFKNIFKKGDIVLLQFAITKLFQISIYFSDNVNFL